MASRSSNPCLTSPTAASASGGWGGSMIIVDLERRMTMAYVVNVMEAGIVGGLRSEVLLRAAYAAVATH